MAAIPERGDPTLEAIDREMERQAAEEPRRSYLGASQIGEPCERKLWYSIQPGLPREDWNALSLRRFEDGHRSEDVMAARLRMVAGVELATHDDHGNQYGFSDLGGMFRGHVDGLIRGLVQAIKTEHIWEAKAVNDKKFQEFRKLKVKLGEKHVLKEWDFVYWAQAQIYMLYFDITRCYLTVMTPGAREHDSCRTELDRSAAEALREKARRIIMATEPPARISERQEFFRCKFCEFREICHG